MNACYTVGDMDAILSLGEQLRAQNLTPDHVGYHLIVTSHISKLVRREGECVRDRLGEKGTSPVERFVFLVTAMGMSPLLRPPQVCRPKPARCISEGMATC